MSTDPMDLVQQEEEKEEKDAAKSRLNVWVALTVALLATFLAICNIKGGNIAQGMQEAQKQSIDNWGWYQAKKTRLELYQATLTQLRLAAAAAPTHAPASAKAAYAAEIQRYQAKIAEQSVKLPNSEFSEMEQKQKDAAAQDELYKKLNDRDDQFDLTEGMISLAIALLALTSLTGKRWMFFLALVPSVFGVVMGVCGLLGLPFHPDALIAPLT